MKAVTVSRRPGPRLFSHARLRRQTDVLEADVRILDAEGLPAGEIAGLRVERVARRGRPEEWLYEMQWLPEPLAAENPGIRAGHWLVFADRGGLGAALQPLIEEHGGSCVLLAPGEFSPDVLRDLTPYRGIVHLWSLDADSVESAQTMGCASVLQLVQELAKTG